MTISCRWPCAWCPRNSLLTMRAGLAAITMPVKAAAGHLITAPAKFVSRNRWAVCFAGAGGGWPDGGISPPLVVAGRAKRDWPRRAQNATLPTCVRWSTDLSSSSSTNCRRIPGTGQHSVMMVDTGSRIPDQRWQRTRHRTRR